jgi:hypothetical protein
MKKLICLVILSAVFFTINAQEDSLGEYTGVYTFPAGSAIPSVEMKLENGVLVGYSQMGNAPLEKISKDTFSITTYGGMAYFTRDSEKKVNGVKIEVQGAILEGRKDGVNLTIWMKRENLLTYANFRSSLFTRL